MATKENNSANKVSAPIPHREGQGGGSHVLDITKEHCPMTFVKTKIELSKLQPGDILEVLLAEGEPLDNVPRNAREQGYNVLSVEHVEGTTYKVTIKK
jgi:TusA-related sulfurtransferase